MSCLLHTARIGKGKTAPDKPMGAPPAMIDDQLLDGLLKCCGGSRILHIAIGTNSLVPRLLDEGWDAYALLDDPIVASREEQRTPGRVHCGNLAQGVPWPDRHFDTVIASGIMESLNETATLGVLSEIGRISRGSVVLIIACTDPSVPHLGTARSRWEDKAFAAGFRRHPCYQKAVPFHAMDRKGGPVILILEQAPFPLNDQNAPANDWLRRTGPGVDAHEALYHLAADMITPGQTVIDATAGAGAGTAILARRGEAARYLGITADPAGAAIRYGGQDPRISFMAADLDGSVDVAVAIGDTIPDLRRLAGWVRPGGRLIAGVPVSQWPAVAQALDQGPEGGIAIDRRFALCPEEERGQHPLADDEAVPNAEGGWVLAVAVRSPFVAIDPVERMRRASAERYHVRAWWRDYDNPRLVETLVNQGSRVHNRTLLSAWVERAAQGSRPGSPDQGAALCVQAYRLLEDPAAPWSVLEHHLKRLLAFVQDADGTMHSLRWRVSLLYAAGLLYQRGGHLREALDHFVACGSTDVYGFSATLGTKTVSAFLKAGRLALTLDGPARAADLWRRGMQEARRLLQGDWSNVWGDIDSPFWIETLETAEVVDLALDCAKALSALPDLHAHPGLLQEKLAWGRAGMAGELFRLQKEVLAHRHSTRSNTHEAALWKGVALASNGCKDRLEKLLHHLSPHGRAIFDDRWPHALLSVGALELGWEADQKARRIRNPGRCPSGMTAWDGTQAGLGGGRLLVWKDGGLGEEIMFSSCLPDLVEQGVSVTVECEPRLVALYARSFPMIQVVPTPAEHDAPAPEGCRCHIAVTALPGLLRNRQTDFPARAGWLSADSARVNLWRQRLDALGPGLAVGVCWRGGDAAIDGLAAFAPLAAESRCHLISLQYGAQPEELAWADHTFPRPLHRWPDLDLTYDLDGVAALIASLDLVISPPTMVTDLAGALGVQVWRCCWDDDWAALGRLDRPWYSTMTALTPAPGQNLNDAIFTAVERVRAMLRVDPGNGI